MGIITEKELEIARRCAAFAKDCGASAARITLSKGIQNSICTLEGKVDRILSSTDRSLLFQIFADGAYGTFSTNMLEGDDLEGFVRRAVETTGILAPDPCYSLPEASLKAAGPLSGNEMELVDPKFFEIPQQDKIALALKCHSGMALSEEGEYSDSFDDNFITDTDGFEGRSMETSYNFSSAVTLRSPDSLKYTGYWWDSRTFWEGFNPFGTGIEAVRLAKEKFDPRPIKSGKYNIVVDRSCSSKLLRPIISAMSGYSIFQHNSFLEGKVGEQVFSPHLGITDRPAMKGIGGSRLFDSEGVALHDAPLVEKGVLKQYFINTYMSAKMGMPQTTEAVTRPLVEPWICNSFKKTINLEDLMHCCGNGLYITGFNGGNCNPSTGNFSFGVEGFLFRDGESVHPFSEALLTGNIPQLWNNLMGAGSDGRECQLWRVPSLAFSDVDINA